MWFRNNLVLTSSYNLYIVIILWNDLSKLSKYGLNEVLTVGKKIQFVLT